VRRTVYVSYIDLQVRMLIKVTVSQMMDGCSEKVVGAGAVQGRSHVRKLQCVQLQCVQSCFFMPLVKERRLTFPHTHALVSTRTCAHTHTHTCTHMHTHAHTHIHTYTRTRTHAHTYVYTGYRGDAGHQLW